MQTNVPLVPQVEQVPFVLLVQFVFPPEMSGVAVSSMPWDDWDISWEHLASER
jgi:hypothetical protein